MRKVLSLILVLMMLVSIVPVSVFADVAEVPAEADTPAAAEVSTDTEDPVAAGEENPATPEIIDSGVCGYELIWTLNENGQLTIGGVGYMYDYAYDSYDRNPPWGQYTDIITSVIIKEGVTIIGSYSFFDCANLTSVVFPDSLRSIGEMAFGECIELTGVVFPDGLTSIGEAAFYDCAGLTSVDIPDSVTNLGQGAFAGCTGITNLSIGRGVKTIGADTFNCTGITNLTIPENVTYIGMASFVCETLETVTICGDVDFVSEYAFAGCCELKEFSVLGSVREFDVQSFRDSGMQSITIPEGTERVGAASFCTCPNLEEIYLPASMRVLEPGLCYMCSNLHKAVFSGDAPAYQPLDVYDYSDLEERLSAEFNTMFNTIINAGVFYGAAEDFTIYAPEASKASWQTPDAYDADAQTWHGYPIVFYGEEPDSPEIIASGYCGGDTTAEYDEASHAYKNLSWTLDDEGTLTVSGNGMMMDRVADNIPWAAYAGDIKTVKIEEGVTTIGVCALAEFIALEELTLPESLEAIYGQAFLYDGALVPGAFESVFIPKNVRCIQPMAFYGCYNLKSIEIDEDNPYLTSDGLTVYTKDMKKLLYSETRDTELVIPDGVTDIWLYAFYSNETIESVTIPASVEAIDPGVFYFCPNLVCAKFEGDAPSRAAFLNPETFVREGMFLYEGDMPGFLPEEIFLECARDFKILAPASCTSWKGEGYDAEAQTWYGYPIEFYDDEPSAEIIASGYCGGDTTAEYDEVSGTYKNLSWTLDAEGTLTISGTGKMGDFEDLEGYLRWYAPWEEAQTQAQVQVIKLIVEPGVTSISDGAFRGCSKLTEVSLPEGVTEIGCYAFSNYLKSVSLPSSLTNVYKGAFGDEITDVYYAGDMGSWVGIMFENRWTTPLQGGANLYIGGELVEHAVIPASAGYINDYAFYGCRSITDVTIADGVTGIGECAFECCEGLKTVSIPASVNYMGPEAFYNCFNLEDVSISKDAELTRIEYYTFGECFNLKHLDIPDSVTELDDCAIYYCSSLEEVTIPQGVKRIGVAAFYQDETLESIVIPDSVEILDETAFAACWNLSSVTLGNGITHIGLGAIGYCAITEITIPASVTEIVEMAFYGCTALEKATFIGDAPATFGEAVFDLSADNFTIYAPRGYSGWTDPAVFDAEAQTWHGYPIVFYGEEPDSPEIIASGYCGGDTTADYDEASGAYKNLSWTLDAEGTLTVSGNGMMMDRVEDNRPWDVYTDDIKNVIIEEGVTTIGVGAFAEFYALEELTLPESLEAIYGQAFLGCGAYAAGGLESVFIPKNVRCIQPMAFCDCYNLKSIEIDEDNPYFTSDGLMVYTKDMKTLVYYETKDTELVISDGITDIWVAAFYYNETIKSVTIPASVEAIDPGAFYICTNLSCAKFEGDAPSRAASLNPDTFIREGMYLYEDVPGFLPEIIFLESARDFKILAPECNATWKGEGYDAEAQTWYGYPIEFYGEHSYAVSSVKEATCTEQGETVYTCPVCGDSYTEYTPALGHDYVDGVCTRCGDVTTVGGSCGDAEWELSPDGTLTIGGSGSTEDSENPWEGIADRVTDIEVGSGVTELDFDAFDEFENLENINISGSSQNFSSINGVVYNKNANELIYCPRGKTGEYEVHGGLKTIRAYAFAGCTKLQVMVIANSITTIGDHAFDGCSSLVNVAFTDSEPKTVGKAIFDNCAPDFCISAVNANGKWLKSARYDAKTQTWNGYPIRFGEKTIVDSDNTGDIRWDVDKYGNLEIGSDGTADTAADLSNVRADVKTVSIAEGTTGIAAGQFEDFENLEAVSIPDTVTEIGDGAFAGCENLYELSIPESVTDIGDGVFSGCDKLTEINVDENNPNYSSVDGKLYNKDGSELICVPAGAGDESFTVPDTVDKIGDGAFADCGALTEVVMTEGITEIGAGAFEGCDNLESIKVENPAPKRMLMAARRNAAADVTVTISLPASVKVIGENAFRGCDCINAMNISANVEVIGSGAFADCANLTAINVDASNANYCSVNGMLLTKDGKTLLCVPAGMSGEYTLPETVSAIADGAFDGCTAELALICPDALKGCCFGKCVVKFAGDGEAHSYEKLVVAPTCTSEGYTVVITDGVEGEHSDITEKAPHKYGAWHVTKAASCTENGVKERCCVCCGDVQTSVIECGHSYSYVVIPATCTADGCTRYTCDVCGNNYDADITPACHELIHHDGKAPTCTESGWAEYDTCGNCDYSTYEAIPARGHSFGEWQLTKEPTCTENGSEEHVCSECGATESRSVAKLGHDYQDGVCQRCGAQEPTSIITVIVNAINTVITTITNFVKSLFSWLPF